MEKPPTFSASSKRLLGLREFDPTEPAELKDLFGSDERISIWNSIETDTYPRGPKREMKKNLVVEVLKKKLIDEELLKENPVVYIGSGVDIDYPLSLGARNITMIDPIFCDEAAIQDIKGRIERFKPEKISENRFKFDFDFGKGKESVNMTLSPETYGQETGSAILPERVAAILLFASQSPAGTVEPDEVMKKRLARGGLILNNADVIKITDQGEEKIRLGR
jgi:hypothetical protein